MMYGYGDWGMMSGMGYLGALTWLVLFIDLVLVGVWLWKQINRRS